MGADPRPQLSGEAQQQSLSALLAQVGSSDPRVQDELARRLHDRLRALAARQLRGLAVGASLQATDLVHEAWLRFQTSDGLSFADRGAFFAFASSVMRSVLVDRARAAAALRRGGELRRVSFVSDVQGEQRVELDLLAVEEALKKLEASDAVTARLVELRFFGGLTHPEIAEVIGISLRGVERRWRFARAWLHTQLGD